jgi:hypothetical protein
MVALEALKFSVALVNGKMDTLAVTFFEGSLK